MKNLINNFKYRLSFLFVLAVNVLVFASPIDDYIIYLAIVGLFVIYYTYKKSNRLVKN
jgi:hypothetical protein